MSDVTFEDLRQVEVGILSDLSQAATEYLNAYYSHFTAITGNGLGDKGYDKSNRSHQFMGVLVGAFTRSEFGEKARSVKNTLNILRQIGSLEYIEDHITAIDVEALVRDTQAISGGARFISVKGPYEVLDDVMNFGIGSFVLRPASSINFDPKKEAGIAEGARLIADIYSDLEDLWELCPDLLEQARDIVKDITIANSVAYQLTDGAKLQVVR